MYRTFPFWESAIFIMINRLSSSSTCDDTVLLELLYPKILATSLPTKYGSSSIRTVLTEPKLSFVNILILFSDIKIYLRKKVLTKTEVYDRIYLYNLLCLIVPMYSILPFRQDAAIYYIFLFLMLLYIFF